MIRIEVKGLEEVQTMLQQLRVEKIPTAARNAINDTAFGLKKHLQDLIQNTFKNPHPSTVKNIFVVKATKENMAARVRYDQLYRRGVDEYMLALIEGGGRTKKPSEIRLGSFLVPASRTNPGILNKYGNISGGKMMQVLSRLSKMETYSGAMQNITARSQAKMAAGKRSTEYFMIKAGDKGGLKPGIYLRTAKRGGFTSHGAPRAVKGVFGAKQQGGIVARGALPVVLFTKAPSYRPMLPFFTSGTEYVNKALVTNFNKEIQYHLSQGGGR
jgi:hypothetical protein